MWLGMPSTIFILYHVTTGQIFVSLCKQKQRGRNIHNHAAIVKVLNHMYGVYVNTSLVVTSGLEVAHTWGRVWDPKHEINQDASRPDSSAFYLGICRTSIQNWKICSNSHEKLTKSGII